MATNPLDELTSRRSPSGWELSFDNAALRVGAASVGASYQVEWSRLDNLTGRNQPAGDRIALGPPRVSVPDSARGPEDDAKDRYAVASSRTVHPDFREPVVVSLRDRRREVQLVGIERSRTAVER